MKITVDISEEEVGLIRLFLASTREVTFSTHGQLNMQKLASMLLQDVALMVQRPGSWEGANMAQVMSSHGYSL